MNKTNEINKLSDNNRSFSLLFVKSNALLQIKQWRAGFFREVDISQSIGEVLENSFNKYF